MQSIISVVLFAAFSMSAAVSCLAQSIDRPLLDRTELCIGDTLRVTYTARGTFSSTNTFVAQISSDSTFTTFDNYPDTNSASGTISIPFASAASRLRLRIISTDPFLTSANNGEDIRVSAKPYGAPISIEHRDEIGIAAFVDEVFHLKDNYQEPTGSKFHWEFDGDANVVSIDSEVAELQYRSVGSKSAHLMVTTPGGCSITRDFSIDILGCNPKIAGTAHVVTGIETGADTIVWIKAGGSYTALGDILKKHVFFVEPGASLYLQDRLNGTYYLRKGASFGRPSGDNQFGSIVLDHSIRLSLTSTQLDTFYCDDLSFDYSGVNNRLVALSESVPSIFVNDNILYYTNEGKETSIDCLNQLGQVVAAANGFSTLILRLPRTHGIYFVIISSEGVRSVEKITR